MRRLPRLIALAAAAAGVTAAVRALSSRDDPLPTPAAGPSEGAWPPLRNETEAPTVPEPAPAPTGTPETTGTPAPETTGTPAPETTGTPAPETAPAPPVPGPDASPAVLPEPAGVPVADEPSPGSGWVAPNQDGSCPEGHPIKAKMSSRIFHSPGQMNYDRCAPDRCYADAAAAEADGLRAAKR